MDLALRRRPTRRVVLGVGIAAVIAIPVAIAVAVDGSVEGPATATEVAERVANATSVPSGPSTSISPPSTVLPPAVSGPLSAPHPTLENISVLWDSGAGDGSSVAVRFREFGTSVWFDAMPLRRVPGASNEGFTWTSRHAGSIFGVAPGTTYEIEARLTDPGGGDDVRTISATTRSAPTAMAGAPVKPATPATLAAVLATAEPGDVVSFGAGSYSGFNVDRSGQPGKPIVLRGTPGAVVAGELGIFGQAHVHIEDLTIDGRIRFNGSDYVAITGNTINATAALGGHGIITYLRAQDAYIADNIVNGLTDWTESSMGASGDNLGEGILVTGPGHVIEHNRVTGMRDGISLLEEVQAVDQFSIDIVNNDIFESADDGVEADFCQHNCRVVDNRITNSFVALSSQPGLGGPTYFVRNSMYNVAHVAFKLYRGSRGDVLLNNTVVKSGDAFGIYTGEPVIGLYMRNNLLIGGPGDRYNGFGNGEGRVFDVAQLDTSTVDADHDGFGSTASGPFSKFFGKWGGERFDSVAEFRAETIEAHAVEIGLVVFDSPVELPVDATVRFPPVDLRIVAESAAADAGVALPTITGGAAHLGAVAVGAPSPTYGPRGS